MVESALNVAAEIVLEYSQNGIALHRAGNRGPGASPQGVYRCRGDDDWVALAVLDDAVWKGLAALIGRQELGHDTVLTTEAGRRSQADQIDKLLSDWTASAAVSDAVRALREHGVAAAAVVAPPTLLDDEHLLARGFWETVQHPVVGSYRCTGMPFTFVGWTSPLGSDATACLRPAHQRGADGCAGADRRRSRRSADGRRDQRPTGRPLRWPSRSVFRRAPASCARRCASCCGPIRS